MKYNFNEFIKDRNVTEDELMDKIMSYYIDDVVIGYETRADQLRAYKSGDIFPATAVMYELNDYLLNMNNEKMYLVEVNNTQAIGDDSNARLVVFDIKEEAKEYLNSLKGKMLPELKEIVSDWTINTNFTIDVRDGLKEELSYDFHIFTENREIGECYNLSNEMKDALLQISDLLDKEINGYFIEHLGISDRERFNGDAKDLRLYVTLYNPDADESISDELLLGNIYPTNVKDTLINDFDWEGWKDYFKSIEEKKGNEITL